jgi:hypothetical protein
MMSRFWEKKLLKLYPSLLWSKTKIKFPEKIRRQTSDTRYNRNPFTGSKHEAREPTDTNDFSRRTHDDKNRLQILHHPSIALLWWRLRWFDQLTQWSTVLLKKLIVAHLVKKFRDFMEPGSSLPCSQEPARGLVKHFEISCFYCDFLAPRPTTKLENHPSSAVRDCLFDIFAATLQVSVTGIHMK